MSRVSGLWIFEGSTSLFINCMCVSCCFFLIHPADVTAAIQANVCCTGNPYKPDTLNNLLTERQRIHVSLGQEHGCPPLFIPPECKLLLSSCLMSIEKNAFARSIASCHVPVPSPQCQQIGFALYWVNGPRFTGFFRRHKMTHSNQGILELSPSANYHWVES